MTFIKFNSRRSTVYSTKGIVSSTQPLANAAGIAILSKGGNSVEAAIAVSAALCITEPGSTGIGGDCFALYFKKDKNSNKGKVLGLNGSGRAAEKLLIQDVLKAYGEDTKRIPATSVFAVTVPGAIAGWWDAYKEWGSGKVTFEEILQPAIDLASNGFPVSQIASHSWNLEIEKLKKSNSENIDKIPFIIDGTGPKEGQFVKNQLVADALTLIGKQGKEAFYLKGPIPEALLKETGKRNHKLSKEDLASHTSTFVDPISLNFQGYEVWEIPPNGHGLVALIALGVIQELHKSGKINLYELKHNSPEYLHILIEASKIGFYDSDEYVTDPKFKDIPIKELLNEKYLSKRSELFHPNKIIDNDVIDHAVPDPKYKSDTVYLTVSDSNGELCSFINSVFEGFGTGIVVPEYGFALQSRGASFNLTAGASNSLEGGKRPYHTIIPGFITKDDEFYASFGNMGGFAQPVCHVQHVLNLIIFGFTPQQLTDSPRFVLGADDKNSHLDRGRGANGPVSTPVTIVNLEEGIEQETIAALKKLGHTTKSVSGYSRSTFGRAQITQNVSSGGQLIYASGSDLRGDGASVAF